MCSCEFGHFGWQLGCLESPASPTSFFRNVLSGRASCVRRCRGRGVAGSDPYSAAPAAAAAVPTALGPAPVMQAHGHGSATSKLWQ